MDLRSALRHHGGVATRAALASAGVGRRELERALARGWATRGWRGQYVATDLDPRLLPAAITGGALSCSSAAVVLGLPVLNEPTRAHVTVSRNYPRRDDQMVVHRRDLRPDEREGLVTAPLRTVLDCARCLPLPEAVVVADAALRAGVDRDALLAGSRELRGHGAARARDVINACDPSAESPLETLTRLLLVRGGWDFRPQVWINGVGRVDFLVEGFLVIEADGFQYHADRDSYRNDRRRTNALIAAGYTVLRFSYEDLVRRPDHVLRTIQRVIMLHSAGRAS